MKMTNQKEVNPLATHCIPSLKHRFRTHLVVADVVYLDVVVERARKQPLVFTVKRQTCDGFLVVREGVQESPAS